MSYLSLYRKWRPGTFADVLGQAHVTETLAAALREDRVSHAYLFAGPRGTGKTSTARILAKALNCEQGVTTEPCGTCRSCKEVADGTSLDVYEMDAASHTSVDDVREIRDRIPFAAVSGGHKVYIIDEAHQLSTPAFNALLKMLEEPPPHVVFVLCTTESHKLPATVVSRCQRFEFRRAGPSALAELIARVASSEDLEVEEGALRIVSRHSHGSFRDALSLLDQAAGGQDGPVTERTMIELLGEAPEEVLLELGAAISSGDVPAAFRTVERVVDRGWDPRQLLRQVLEHLRLLFLARRGADDLLGDLDDEQRVRVREQAQSFTAAHLEWAMRVLANTQADVRWSSHPRLTLEVALARAARLDAEDTEALRARVERLERVLLAGGAPVPVPVARSAPLRPAQPAPTRPAAAPSPVRPETSRPAVQQEPARQEPARPVAADASLQERWEAVLEAVRAQSRVTHTHLKAGWPIEICDGALRVGFEEKQRFHGDEIVKRPDQLSRVLEAMQDAFGDKLRFEPVVQGTRPEAAVHETVPETSDPLDLVVRGLSAEVVEEVES